MKKTSFVVGFLWLSIGCGIAGTQSDAPPDASDAPVHASYDGSLNN
jgi:hypothetical protein